VRAFRPARPSCSVLCTTALAAIFSTASPNSRSVDQRVPATPCSTLTALAETLSAKTLRISSCRRLASTVGSAIARRRAPLSSITFKAANSSAPSSTPPAERVSFSSVCSCANESRDACDITQLHMHSWSRPVLFPDLPGSGQRHVVNVHHRQALRPRSWTPVVLQEYRLRYAV